MNKEKRAELELIAGTENPVLIGITETWANESIQNYEYKNISSTDISYWEKTGRVKRNLVMELEEWYNVNNCIKAIIREDFQFENFKDSLWCDIYLDKFKLLVGVCHRPPNSKDETGLFEAIRKTSRVPALIIRYFNYHIEWNSLTGERSEDTNFLNCLKDAFLFQHVQNPTRCSNILNLVMTTEENMVYDLTVFRSFLDKWSPNSQLEHTS